MNYFDAFIVPTIYVRCVLLIFLIKTLHCQNNPCPQVFQYNYDNFDNLYGLVTVPTPIEYNVVQLKVDLVVGNWVENTSENMIQFIGNIEDLYQRKPLRYKIRFPHWINSPPLVTKITVNNVQLCSGRNSFRRWTILHLYHVLESTSTPNYYFDSSNPRNVENIPFQMFPTNSKWYYNKTSNNYPNYPKINDVHQTFSNGNPYYNNHRQNDLNVPSSTTQKTFIQEVTDENFKALYTPTIDTFRNKAPSYNSIWSYANQCGKSLAVTHLIVNGDEIDIHKHPWMGAIFEHTPRPQFICGSTLVSSHHVITAAHCVKKRRVKNYWIVFGRSNINDWLGNDYQLRQVSKVFIHPDFGEGFADADIAVVILSEEVTLTSHVQPACIWINNNDSGDLFKGEVLGWGKNEYNVINENLRRIPLEMVSSEECKNSNEYFKEYITDRTFCVGYRNNSGPCEGDSGGGFFINVNGKWRLKGLVAYSLSTPAGMCDLTNYVVFIDISKFVEWLLTCCN